MERYYRIEYYTGAYWTLPERGIRYSSAIAAEHACRGYSYYPRRVVCVEMDGTVCLVSLQ